jgi:hypothetical protein
MHPGIMISVVKEFPEPLGILATIGLRISRLIMAFLELFRLLNLSLIVMSRLCLLFCTSWPFMMDGMDLNWLSIKKKVAMPEFLV